MSVSTTHRQPRQHSSMSTCKASCTDRLGRNPNEHGSMSASKTGSSTIFTADCTIRSRTVGIDSGLCAPSGLPGLGISTRRAGSGRYRPSLSSAGQLAKQPVYAVLLDLGQGGPVDARSAVIRTHHHPRTLEHVPAADLVCQRVEPPPGIGLGRPVQRMLQGTDRISRDIPARSLRGGTSPSGTHRAPPKTDAAHRRSSGPSLTAGYAVLPGSTGTTAASDAHPASNPLPGLAGYRTPRSGNTLPQATGPGRASPVPAVTI